jgi:putative MATE family efflux protein
MLEFSIPAIVGLAVNGLYSIIDSIFLGRVVGASALAAVTVAMPLLSIGFSIAMLIGAGGNALAALRLGEGKNEDAERILGNTMTLCIIACVLIAILTTVFIDPLMIISGVTPEIWDGSKLFILILTYGYILQFIGMVFSNFIRTAGDPNRALYTSVAGTAVCIVFNYLFVLVFGWGIAGSAFATILGQMVSAALMLWFFIFSSKAPFKLRLRYLRPEFKLCLRILVLGSASFVMSIAMTIVGFFLNNLLVVYGAVHPIGSEGALATIGVIQRLGGFIFYPLLGVAIAAQPLWGYNYGAANYGRVKRTTNIALLWMFVIGAFFWVLILLFARQIVSIFGIEDTLIDFTAFALIVQMFMFPLVGIQMVGSNYFQSTGQPIKSMFLSLTRQILYLFPLLFILPRWLPLLVPSLTPLDTLYFTFPISDLLSIITTAVLLFIEYRKLRSLIAAETTEFA